MGSMARNFVIIPGISESDAIKYGTLTEQEKEIYRAVFFNRTATTTMINECKAVKENAKKVESLEVPQVSMLLFLSDASGGTGFDKETWRRIPKEYIGDVIFTIMSMKGLVRILNLFYRNRILCFCIYEI